MSAHLEVPDRSLEQRRSALLIANEIRVKRAVLKNGLRDGKVSVRDTLLEPPAVARTMKVSTVLLATPQYGRVKVDKILRLCRISPSKTIGGLTPRQRTELVSMLRRPTGSRELVRPARGTGPDSQHMRALRAANSMRLDRADLKRQVATGETTVPAVLREVPDAAVTMPIAELIMSQHRWGTTRTRRFLASVPLPEMKAVGLMTIRQRGEVADRLAEGWL